MEYYYTEHAMDRFKERLNQNNKSAKRQIQLALERGKTAQDFTSSIEKKYLDDRTNLEMYALAYNGCCFIVEYDTNRVITVYGLPNWWEKKKNYAGKNRIKKAKAYYRLNDLECMAI